VLSAAFRFGPMSPVIGNNEKLSMYLETHIVNKFKFYREMFYLDNQAFPADLILSLKSPLRRRFQHLKKGGLK